MSYSFTYTQSDEIWTVKDALDALAVRETVHMSEVRTCDCDDRLPITHNNDHYPIQGNLTCSYNNIVSVYTTKPASLQRLFTNRDSFA